MPRFAKLDSNNIVTEVIVIDQETLNLGHWGDPATWKETSYTTHGGQQPDGRPLRKNYAGKGFSYDPVRDAFIPPKPFPSWLLNEDTCLWDAPIPTPTDGKFYQWDEPTTSWVEVTPVV